MCRNKKLSLVSLVVFCVLTMTAEVPQWWKSWRELRYHSPAFPVYVIDSISGIEPTIVESEKTGHCYAFTEYANMKGMTDQNILETDNTFIYQPLFFNFVGKDLPKIKPYLPAEPESIPQLVTDESQPLHHAQGFIRKWYEGETPDYYLRILVRGDYYNDLCLKYGGEHSNIPIKFPDEYAFYPLLMPVFKTN